MTNWFRDPDTGDTLTYAVSGLPDGDWLELDDTMGELTIAANATDDAEVGRHTFTLTAADGDGESVVLVVTLAVANVNEAPALTAAAPTADAPLTVDEGEAMTWDIAAWFRDPDAGDTLTYTVSGNPDWLVFDAAMGELTIAEGATDDAQVGSYTLAVTASDGDDETAVHTLTLTVANVNEAPVVTSASAMLTAMEGEAATWTLTNWFRDPDAGDTLTYAVSGNPAWLTLDEATEALTIAAGATDDAEVGSYTLALTATDAGGETALAATHTLTLAVENTNDAPAVVTEGDSAAPATVTATEGLAFSEAVSGWFTDEGRGRHAHLCGGGAAGVWRVSNGGGSTGLAQAGRRDGGSNDCGGGDGRRPGRHVRARRDGERRLRCDGPPHGDAGDRERARISNDDHGRPSDAVGEGGSGGPIGMLRRGLTTPT